MSPRPETTASEPVAADAATPEFPTDLPETDGEPLESDWHRMAINLLIEAIRYHYRHRPDFFAGGNMFVYFSATQVRNRDYRGPDFFFVWGVERDKLRRYWAVWEEDGSYPDVIIELLSPKTAEEDRTTKKRLYERKFRTPNYFLYDPITQKLEGWHLGNRRYAALTPNERGWLWSEELELWLGTWQGAYLETQATWLRFYDKEGNLVLTGREAEKQRADAAEAEAAQLRARLAQLEATHKETPNP
jgi:Uma2 family endonuclease